MRSLTRRNTLRGVTTVMEHLTSLCSVRRDRRPGSVGNLAATEYVAATLRRLGWATELQWFDCLDWESDGGKLNVAGQDYAVVPSPYGSGVSGEARLVTASSLEELSGREAEGAVLLLHGELTGRPLTPLNYPFYSSPEDEHLMRLIETARPLAVVAVTGRYPELCGAMDPFPFIEDGSFTVPVADVGPEVGEQLLKHVGANVHVVLNARRRPARAANVLARRGPQHRRVTVVAHVDSKPGTPGALDNATGVAALLLVAEALVGEVFDGDAGIELLVVNGEDYYAASGEVRYLQGTDIDDVLLAVNLDGVGLPEGATAWSLYGCPPELDARLRGVLAETPGILEGPQWFQSDHAIFAMRGRPALAFTSSDMQTALGMVAHAPTDTPDGVDTPKVKEAAAAVTAAVLACCGARG